MVPDFSCVIRFKVQGASHCGKLLDSFVFAVLSEESFGHSRQYSPDNRGKRRDASSHLIDISVSMPEYFTVSWPGLLLLQQNQDCFPISGRAKKSPDA